MATVVHIAARVQAHAVAGDERAACRKVNRIRLRKIHLRHEHALMRTVWQRHVLRDEPHHIGCELRHLFGRQRNARCQPEFLRILHAVVHQRRVFVEVVRITGEEGAASQLRDLVAHERLFVHTVAHTLLDLRRIEVKLVEHVIARYEVRVLGEARVRRDEIGRAGCRVVFVQAIRRQLQIGNAA
uniref:hypothetical protein n=1 Tax=Paraburkholderia caribensis TaxID=75105 RepID=UPI001314761E|nr:hypothetical protein [Paraburkholderia caribensis]